MPLHSYLFWEKPAQKWKMRHNASVRRLESQSFVCYRMRNCLSCQLRWASSLALTKDQLLEGFRTVAMDNLLKRRFEELTEQAQSLEDSKRVEYDSYSSTNKTRIDVNQFLNWKVKAKSLLVRACGEDSRHFKEFVDLENGWSSSDFAKLQKLMAVFAAAREDFEGGYLISVHDLVRAEVFGSELQQALELLKNNYAGAAAIIAGTVLETSLRELCDRNQIPYGKLDKMNADLAKSGVYNGIVQKRITHLAAIRNSAAHGNEAEFKSYDVKSMIDEIEQFLANHMS